MYPVQGMIMATTFTAAEVSALTGLDERRVRKDVEYGVLGSARPRFDLAALVYFRAVTQIGFELGVTDRRRLRAAIRKAMATKPRPKRLALSAIVALDLALVVEQVSFALNRFASWKKGLVTDDRVLGGEPVFPNTRLAVRRVGGMLLRGVPPVAVKEDYPYLRDEDLELAKLYTVAYPRLGRPREAVTR